jgi:hypothetical protein
LKLATLLLTPFGLTSLETNSKLNKLLLLLLSLQAADAIKAMLSPTAVVVRGGQRCTVDAATLVPGAQLNPACLGVPLPS